MTSVVRAVALSPLLVLPALLLAGCGGGTGNTAPVGPGAEPAQPAPHPMSAPSAKPAQANAPEAPADPHQVFIDNFTFSPRQLTVPAGTRVTWVNREDVPHTATSTSKPRVFDSCTLDTDERFSRVFTTPGTYEYFCILHPKMTGQIVVK
jgi:plastocyanin